MFESVNGSAVKEYLANANEIFFFLNFHLGTLLLACVYNIYILRMLFT